VRIGGGLGFDFESQNRSGKCRPPPVWQICRFEPKLRIYTSFGQSVPDVTLDKSPTIGSITGQVKNCSMSVHLKLEQKAAQSMSAAQAAQH
jgi:hypothetical protein